MGKFDFGIFGVWSGCNYGSVATYYALHQLITSMGKTVLMIDKPIISKNDYERNKTHSRRFAEEHYSISKQYHLNEFEQLNDLCDGFIIGSDQVWNYGISKNFGQHFYLDFAHDEKKKIAYAVSFGHEVDFAPPEKRQEIADLMSRFDGISTREADGVKLCKNEYGIKARQVLDPVFLADPQIYEPLIQKSQCHESEPFLATYILDPTPEKREALLHVSKELGGIKIINMLDGLPWTFENNKKLMNLPNCIENLQVEDWLYYLSHAQFVITDSCHGASFAIIFKRNFIAITNKRRGFSRFKSLAQLFKFEDRLITDPKRILTDKHLLDPVNYNVIDKIMEKQRKDCYAWLKKCVTEPKRSLKDLKSENIIGKPHTAVPIDTTRQSAPDPRVKKPQTMYPFRFDHTMWEAHYIVNNTVLVTKTEKPGRGNFAFLPLKKLDERKRYELSIRFKVKSAASQLTFHAYNSQTRAFQILHRHNIEADNAVNWVTLKIPFEPNSSEYDSFMIGALQISGENRAIVIDYVDFLEVQS